MANTFVVRANQNSVTGGVGLNTGISVGLGDLLTISVPPDDTWSAGPGNRTSNANGLGNPLGQNFGVFTKNGFSAQFGSLVGSLDGGNTFFAVGTRMEMTILAPNGHLTLYYWDSDNVNNSGSVTATVAVYRGPVL